MHTRHEEFNVARLREDSEHIEWQLVILVLHEQSGPRERVEVLLPLHHAAHRAINEALDFYKHSHPQVATMLG